jgi:hypothetical protein
MPIIFKIDRVCKNLNLNLKFFNILVELEFE